jgi:hypothetical protein
MSKPNHSNFKKGVFFFAAIIALIAVVGCSKIPTQSDAPKQTNLLKRSLSVAKTAGALHTDTTISAANGGVVSLLDVELTFPPNALANDTLISIDIPDISVFENHFGTDGLQFSVPVKVVMSYRDADLSGVNESTIAIAWYNTTAGEWDKMVCTLDTVNKTVTGYLEHFSAYALISD